MNWKPAAPQGRENRRDWNEAMATKAKKSPKAAAKKTAAKKKPAPKSAAAKTSAKKTTAKKAPAKKQQPLRPEQNPT
ncbi:RNase R, 3'-5' exoribonuclease [Tepidicaulis marinus]|uniref:RNase R, 3'-5' exoribonuclease n=1 Tax=Tepidicaulis marinus TaxID=1333998 RepID=A0A081BBM7_9HYPH|nr:RNase R, 3'-5' exoribonuclease [Tepidicaulis marinus]